MNQEFLQARKENDKSIELSNALKKLCTNPDFVLVFENYYFKDYTLDLVSRMALSNNTDEIVQELNAISCVKKFLDTITTNGAMAQLNNDELMTILDESEIYE